MSLGRAVSQNARHGALDAPAPRRAIICRMSEQIVFAPAVEGLFVHRLGPRLTPPIRERLRETGLDLDRPLDPGYPAERWAKFVEVAAQELFPGVERTEAHRQLGFMALEGYGQTLLGKAAIVTMKLMGSRRTTQRMGKYFATGTNYMKCVVTERKPNEFEIHFNEVSGVPYFFAGLVGAGSTITGSKNARVEVRDTDGHACTLLLGWDE